MKPQLGLSLVCKKIISFFLTYDHQGGSKIGFMKRLIPFLIILGFFLDLSDGRVGRPHIKDQIHICLQQKGGISAYTPSENLSSKWKEGKNSYVETVSFCIPLEDPPKHVQPPQSIKPFSQRHYCRLGLGCGGLPS